MMSKATRRTFLKIVAGGVAVAGAGYVILGELHYLPVWLFPRGSKPQAQRLSASALRPDDFVSLDFDFENFYLDTSVNPATLNVAAYPGLHHCDISTAEPCRTGILRGAGE